MKKIIILFISTILLNASWKMFNSKDGTFMYNEQTGEIYRYYQVINNKTLTEEGLVRVKFTSYAKYPIRNRVVSPVGFTPKKMKQMEDKLIDSVIAH